MADPLLDQANAAAAEGLAFMRDFKEAKGGEIIAVPPGGCTARFHLELAYRLQARLTVPCAHLSPGAPQPMYWVPWDPEVVGCRACHDVANANITGTLEDDRCDGCGAYPGRDQLYAVASQLTGGGYFPHLRAATGPVTIHFGLCPDCYAKEIPGD